MEDTAGWCRASAQRDCRRKWCRPTTLGCHGGSTSSKQRAGADCASGGVGGADLESRLERRQAEGKTSGPESSRSVTGRRTETYVRTQRELGTGGQTEARLLDASRGRGGRRARVSFHDSSL